MLICKCTQCHLSECVSNDSMFGRRLRSKNRRVQVQSAVPVSRPWHLHPGTALCFFSVLRVATGFYKLQLFSTNFKRCTGSKLNILRPVYALNNKLCIKTWRQMGQISAGGLRGETKNKCGVCHEVSPLSTTRTPFHRYQFRGGTSSAPVRPR